MMILLVTFSSLTSISRSISLEVGASLQNWVSGGAVVVVRADWVRRWPFLILIIILGGSRYYFHPIALIKKIVGPILRSFVDGLNN